MKLLKTRFIYFNLFNLFFSMTSFATGPEFNSTHYVCRSNKGDIAVEIVNETFYLPVLYRVSESRKAKTTKLILIDRYGLKYYDPSGYGKTAAESAQFQF